MKISFFILAVFFKIVLPQSPCGSGSIPGTVTVCDGIGTNWSKKLCNTFSSGDQCIPLPDTINFRSGFTWGDYKCTAYHKSDCSGGDKKLDRNGGWSLSKFKSIKCPCVPVAQTSCPAGSYGGWVTVCEGMGKNWAKKTCKTYQSTDNCIDLPGDIKFKSGYSGGAYNCKAYHGLSCTGSDRNVDKNGFSAIDRVKSVKCPCVPAAPSCSGGFATVCEGMGKNWSNKYCQPYQSNNQCINLPDGTKWKSGYSGGSYSCTAFHKTDCAGGSRKIDENGFSAVDRVKSLICPCV